MKGFRKWYVILAVIVVLAVAGWLYLEYRAVSGAVADEKKAALATLVTEQAPKFITADDFKNTNATHTAEVFGGLWNVIQSPRYVRMKVWLPDGTVIWSNLAALIGQKFPPFEELTAATNGEVAFDLESQKEENIDERQYDVLAETYVPFVGPDGKIPGVIEVYQTPTVYYQEVNDEFQKALPVPIATGVVAYAVIASALYWYSKKKAQSSTATPAA